MGAYRIVPPTVEPLTVDEAKAHLRYDGDVVPTATLEQYIRSARASVERYCQRPLMSQEWELVILAGEGPAGMTYGVVTEEALDRGAYVGPEVTDSHVGLFTRDTYVWRTGAPVWSTVLGIELPWAAPFDAVVSIEADGLPVAGADYTVDQSKEPAILYLSSLPASTLVVRYRVGWPTSDAVDPLLMTAVRRLVGLNFTHADNAPTGAIDGVLAEVDALRIKSLA